MYFNRNIEKAGEWVVKNKKDIILVIISFLIISLSFMLGYITAKDYSSKTPIVIDCDRG